MPALVFDLDGTLVDSLPGIAASLNRALAACGYPTHSSGTVRSFVGNGARMLVTRALPAGEPPTVIERLERAFKEDYTATWHEGTAAYDGIHAMLEEFLAAGMPMAVLSNKPHALTDAIVAEVFPAGWFGSVLGQREGIPHKPDPAGFFETAAALGHAAADCWMIGDSTADMATARNAAARPAAVTWGYNSRADLIATSPALLADSPVGLARALRGFHSPSLPSPP